MSLSRVFYIATLALFIFSLFRHISYPLLWNDESYGAMSAQRILEYGYPKVHDSKGNVVFEPVKSYPKSLAYHEGLDAFTYITWGGDYFCAIGVYVSKFFDDIYDKTACVRIPFALAAVFALLIFSLSTKKLFSSTVTWCYVMGAFFILQTMSVSFVLHMREARYYALMVLLQAIFIWGWLDWTQYKKFSRNQRICFFTLLYFTTYHVNFALVCIFWAAWPVSYLLNFFIQSQFKLVMPSKEQITDFFWSLCPVILSIICILPFELLLFKTYQIAYFLNKQTTNLTDMFNYRINVNLQYFLKYEWLIAGIILKCVLLYSIVFHRKLLQDSKVSLFLPLIVLLNIIFILSLIVVSRNVLSFLRYIIPFQPIIVMAFVLEFYLVVVILFQHLPLTRYRKGLLLAVVVFSAIFNVNNQLPWIRGRLQELITQVKGPLDYVVPYIMNRFQDPSKLIIATNYETTSFMFYLNSRVIVGYFPFDLEKDLRLTPDILIHRRLWENDSNAFEHFTAKAEYQVVYFPVKEMKVNSIPELFFTKSGFIHQFTTPVADSKEDQTKILILKSSISSE